ncbi:hypothetical protein B6U99_03860, partial [Candidatus Geothermarchaeota archaeon ex4572_27]
LQAPVGRDPTRISERLWALHVDPVKEAAEHYGAIMDYVAAVLKARGLSEVLAYEVASLPGMTGVAAILKLDSIVREDSYDVVVIDTVPSGEALKYLYVPTFIGRISRRLMRVASPLLDLGRVVEPLIGIPTPPGEVLDKEVEILDRMDRLRGYLLDHDVTSIRLIANPDSFSIGNIKRAYMQASIYGLNTDLVIVNKVMPREAASGYMRAWVEEQEKLLEDIRRSFSPLPVKMLRLFESELKGLEMLRRAADELFGDEDPTTVYYRGRGVRVESVPGGVEIIYPMPYVSKGQVEVERVGDELLVHIQTDMGKVSLVIPLPAITYRMRVESARLLSGELHLRFVEEG